MLTNGRKALFIWVAGIRVHVFTVHVYFNLEKIVVKTFFMLFDFIDCFWELFNDVILLNDTKSFIFAFKAHDQRRNPYPNYISSVADPGRLSQILDPNFSISDPGQKDSGSRIRIRILEFKYF